MNGVRIRKTGAPDVIASSDGRLTLSVPIQIKRRSGRKLVTLPGGEAAEPRPWDVAATPMQLALARGYRWLAMLESGEAKSITELADPREDRQQLHVPNAQPDHARARHRGGQSWTRPCSALRHRA
jgi:hypothetical protein